MTISHHISGHAETLIWCSKGPILCVDRLHNRGGLKSRRTHILRTIVKTDLRQGWRIRHILQIQPGMGSLDAYVGTRTFRRN